MAKQIINKPNLKNHPWADKIINQHQSDEFSELFGAQERVIQQMEQTFLTIKTQNSLLQEDNKQFYMQRSNTIRDLIHTSIPVKGGQRKILRADGTSNGQEHLKKMEFDQKLKNLKNQQKKLNLRDLLFSAQIDMRPEDEEFYQKESESQEIHKMDFYKKDDNFFNKRLISPLQMKQPEIFDTPELPYFLKDKYQELQEIIKGNRKLNVLNSSNSDESQSLDSKISRSNSKNISSEIKQEQQVLDSIIINHSQEQSIQDKNLPQKELDSVGCQTDQVSYCIQCSPQIDMAQSDKIVQKPVLQRKQNEMNLDVLEAQLIPKIRPNIDSSSIVKTTLSLEFQNTERIMTSFFNDNKKIDLAVNSLENCKYCSTMLLNLINDLMDLAKLEKMKFELNNEFFDITKTIQRAFETLSYYGQQKQITPLLKIDDKLEPFLKQTFGDENRFTQIFQNFLSNAFKFTPDKGQIIVEFRAKYDHLGQFSQKCTQEKDITNQIQLEISQQISNNENNFEGSLNRIQCGYNQLNRSQGMKKSFISSIGGRQLLINQLSLDSVKEIEELSQDISSGEKFLEILQNVENVNDQLSVFEQLALKEENNSQDYVSVSEESENNNILLGDKKQVNEQNQHIKQDVKDGPQKSQNSNRKANSTNNLANQDFKQEDHFVSFEILIKDSGMGIRKEDQNKLFLNFGKLADTQGKNKSGTGLGLSICKHIIEKMGGAVRVESEGLGTGTTFVIAITSVCKIDYKSLSIVKSKQVQQQKDGSDKQITQIKQINDQAMQEQKKALQSAKRIDSKQSLLIKFQDSENQIIKSDKQFHSQKNLFQKHNKPHLNPVPIDIDEALKKLQVLVINDELYILQMWMMMVNRIDIEKVDKAQNGYDGYKMLQQKQYDFVICDLNMPVMDGYEFCQKVKQIFVDKNLFFQTKNDGFCPYLVACSAYVNDEVEKNALEAGFDVVIQSPLTIELMQKQILLKVFERAKELQKNKNAQNLLMNIGDQSFSESFEGMNQEHLKRVATHLEDLCKLVNKSNDFGNFNQSNSSNQDENEYYEYGEESQEQDDEIQQMEDQRIQKELKQDLEKIEEDNSMQDSGQSQSSNDKFHVKRAISQLRIQKIQ